MILILIPTRFEASLLIKKLKNAHHHRHENLHCWTGTYGELKLTIGLIRVGLPLAAEATVFFIKKFPSKHVILAGFAGGLDPALERGQVLVIPECDISKNVFTAKEVVVTMAQKAELWQKTACRIVEMEVEGVAAEVSKTSAHLTLIRVVSDDAHETIPNETLKYGYDIEKGRETPLKMALHLMTHPKEIGALKRFISNTSPCRAPLAEAILHKCTQLEH